MTFEQAGHEMGGGVLMEVGGQISDPNSFVIVFRDPPDDIAGGRQVLCCEKGRTFQLVLSRRRQSQKSKRRYNGGFASDLLQQKRGFGNKIFSIAEMHLCVGADRFPHLEIRLYAHSFVVSGKGFIVALEFEIDIAEPKSGRGEPGLQLQGSLVSSNRFTVALELKQNIAAPEPSVGRTGIPGQCFIIGSESRN